MGRGHRGITGAILGILQDSVCFPGIKVGAVVPKKLSFCNVVELWGIRNFMSLSGRVPLSNLSGCLCISGSRGNRAHVH